MVRTYYKNIYFKDPFCWKHKFLYSTSKNVYISRDLWRHKVNSPNRFFLVENYMSIPNIYSYIRLSSVSWEVCCIFCIATLCFLKIWCVFGSFMQSVFSQTEYCLETRFCSLPKDGVQHLKSIKPDLICTLVLKGYEGEKTLFSLFLH